MPEIVFCRKCNKMHHIRSACDLSDAAEILKKRYNPSKEDLQEAREELGQEEARSADDKCVEWGKEVLDCVGYGDWKIEFSPGDSEGICLGKTKTIAIHWPSGYPDYALMAHEITHVIYGEPGHDSNFAHKYMDLVRSFFTPNAIGERQ